MLISECVCPRMLEDANSGQLKKFLNVSVKSAEGRVPIGRALFYWSTSRSSVTAPNLSDI